MKRNGTNGGVTGLLFLIGLFICVAFTGCEKGDELDEDEIVYDYVFQLEGITPENYPMTDASTVAAPMQMLIACKLLGWRYTWGQSMDGTYTIFPHWEDIPEGYNYWERIKTSKTHDAILNLIDRDVDFIISARTMSEDEKSHAVEKGVTLIETPIALDAFIFIVNRSNTVKSLTTKEIQDIYTGKITNWSNVGGFNSTIMPYVRNANSGSQELMESLVMKDLKIKEWPEEPQLELGSMMLVFSTVMNDAKSLCYTLFYYNAQMIHENIAKTIAVDGVSPDKKSIGERRYPHIAELYAVIRSDLDKSSMAYKLYELMQTEEAKHLITESGYVPIMNN